MPLNALTSIQQPLSNSMNYKYASLALLSTVLIVYLSSIPDISLWGDGSLSEKIIFNLIHIPAYALLTFLWLKVFEKGKNSTEINIVHALVLMAIIFFAIVDEIHQSFVPNRTASFMDIGLDLFGILCGLAFCKKIILFK